MTDWLVKAREGCDGRHHGDEGWHETAPYCMYASAHQRTATKMQEAERHGWEAFADATKRHAHRVTENVDWVSMTSITALRKRGPADAD